MRSFSASFQSFYCYVDKGSGSTVVSRNRVVADEDKAFFYVAACPNEDIAKKVYERHLAIASL